MSENQSEIIERVQSVQEKVRRILLENWDPIGVGMVPEAQDEYDSYVGRVYRLIATRTGSFPIAIYLFEVETSRMGLTRFGSPVQLELIAQKLADLAAEL